jgi:pyruvate/2-oxoglutarate dehydrogenase complex dihydrolipoamide dehydrogenase (E3) component
MSSPSKVHQPFDLIVIGRTAGQSVAIIEKDKVGGDCPNYACVPTKALLRSAKVYALLKRADALGLGAGDVEFEWAKIIARKAWIDRHAGAATAEEQYQQEGRNIGKEVNIDAPGAAWAARVGQKQSIRAHLRQPKQAPQGGEENGSGVQV